MDYYQGVVREFLQTDRSMFVNEELIIDLDYDGNRPQGKNAKGRHWICDLAAINQREKVMYQGEVTTNKSLSSLIQRFTSWSKIWPLLVESLIRDSHLDIEWEVLPWAFIPKESSDLFYKRMGMIENISNKPKQMPLPKVTCLEDVVPWKSNGWKGRPTLCSVEQTPNPVIR